MITGQPIPSDCGWVIAV